jgi:hypothetical protein
MAPLVVTEELAKDDRLDGRLRQNEPNHSRRDALTASVARAEELPA